MEAIQTAAAGQPAFASSAAVTAQTARIEPIELSMAPETMRAVMPTASLAFVLHHPAFGRCGVLFLRRAPRACDCSVDLCRTSQKESRRRWNNPAASVV